MVKVPKSELENFICSSSRGKKQREPAPPRAGGQESGARDGAAGEIETDTATH